jgi:hypothetical protein
MKVKLLCGRVGARIVQNPGDIIEVGEKEAASLIASGGAVPAGAPKKETATKKDSAEKAAKE